MKKLLTFLLLTILTVTLTACSGTVNADVTSQTVTTASDSPESVQQTQAVSSASITSDYDPDDLTVSVNNADTTVIRLEGDMIATEGSGVTVDGTIATVTSSGVYNIQGILNDGQIVVDTQDAETVTLILSGGAITNTTSAPIYIANAEKTVITLADGTQNSVTDGATYYYPDESDEPNAAIFSHDDLTINGSGALTVNANYKDGIASKDDLKIISGTITVNTVNDGIKGKDSVSIKDGIITINSGADGIQSTNADEVEKGYILIEGGTFNITSGLDGIQAETNLQISGGDFTITSGGGSVNNSTTGGGMWDGRGMEGNPNKPAESAKGLKAGVDITIMAGTFNINSADDSIHSNASLTIDGGNILMASGDDGMHADATLTINDGEINLTQSYEGIESAVLTINDGDIHVASSDDGLNAVGGNDGSSLGGRPGQNMFEASGDYWLKVNGGYLYVDAIGDGLDINGPIDMTGGTVIINGPVDNMNGPLDYALSFNVTGGYLLAVGSSGMAQAPSESSSQYSVLYNFDTIQAAGTLIHIQTQSGQEVLTFMPTKEYQSVLLSSPQLKNGETYVVYTGGSSTGTMTDGLYADGTYIPGMEVSSFSISGMTTYAGTAGGFGPGGGGRPGGGGPGGAPPTRP
jgi:hypothetical protein